MVETRKQFNLYDNINLFVKYLRIDKDTIYCFKNDNDIYIIERNLYNFKTLKI
jgi:hypothetical protein